MNPLKWRLQRCFCSALPDVPVEQISEAAIGKTAEWDSLATLAIIATVEAEFGVMFPVDRLPHLVSFEAVLAELTRVNPMAA